MVESSTHPVRPYVRIHIGEADFAQVVSAWNHYIVSHDGNLPADPYQALLDSGVPGGMRELRWFGFAGDVPPRLNPDLRQNANWLVFVLDRPDLSEEWRCYADGTWGRTKETPTPPSTAAMAAGPPDPTTMLKEAGYPVWTWRGPADRAAWLAANRDRLVWDEGWRMYVARGNSPCSDKITRGRKGGTL